MLEAFAGGGRAVVTQRIYPGPASTGVRAFNAGSTAVTLDALNAYSLKRSMPPTATAQSFI